MLQNLRIDLINKRISRCPKQLPLEISIEDLKKYKGEIFNSPQIQETFSKMKKDELPFACSTCDIHYSKARNKWHNKTWSEEEYKDLNLLSIIPTELDLIFTPVCNMTCMYCDEFHSNQWAKLLGKEYIENQEWDEIAIESLLEYLDTYIIDKVEKFQVRILGGEPLLNWKKLENFLILLNDKFNNSSTILKISIISNMNVLHKNIVNFVEYTKKTKHTKYELVASIDSIGKKAEDIRTGLDWKLFLKNMEYLGPQHHIRLEVSNSVNCFAVKTLQNFYEFWLEFITKYNRNFRTFGFGRNMVTHPVEMSTAILPIEYQEYVVDALDYVNKNYSDHRLIRDLYQYLSNVKASIGTKRTDENLDKIRKFYKSQGLLKKINYFEVHEELTDILTNTKKSV